MQDPPVENLIVAEGKLKRCGAQRPEAKVFFSAHDVKGRLLSSISAKSQRRTERPPAQEIVFLLKLMIYLTEIGRSTKKIWHVTQCGNATQSSKSKKKKEAWKGVDKTSFFKGYAPIEEASASTTKPSIRPNNRMFFVDSDGLAA